MKPLTGQYECVHRSGVGLDYFTSRVDKATLLANGRFTLIVQDRSRISNAAQSFISGQQVSQAAPETRREGTYTVQNNALLLHFDDGSQDQAQLSWNGDGFQLGQDFFTKVSDSTMLPPTHRMKMDMEDIAKGIKIAGTIGGMAMKAAKTIQDTIQASQGPDATQNTASPQTQQPPAPQQQQRPAPQPMQQPQSAPPRPTYSPPPQQPPAAPQLEAVFCDQCGARVRPGKRFCNNCGAPLT